MSSVLLVLLLVFAELSLAAFGGGNSILPEMQRQIVKVHHWMSAQEFAALFALAQAAPGPNMMVAPLLGWRIAGWPGLAAAALGMFGPSFLLTSSVVRLWERFKAQPWRAHLQAGLAPITVGLVASSAALIAPGAVHGPGLALLAAASALVLIATRTPPLLVLAAGAAIGLAGLGQG